MKEYKFREEQEHESYSGRGGIDSPNRTSGSNRAMKGNLSVVKSTTKRCLHCGHNKFLVTGYGKTKCARCKNEAEL